MGQRLVIELYDGKTRLANAYYHWSAFTLSSLRLLNGIVDYLMKSEEPNLKLKAIRALEETGAGLWGIEDKELAQSLFKGKNFTSCTDRNEGLIAITKGTMDNLFDSNEGFIKVDISNNSFVFDVCWVNEDPIVYNEYGNEIMLDEEDEVVKNLVKTSFNLDCIYFEELDTFIQLCEEISDTSKCAQVTDYTGKKLFMMVIM